MSITPKFIHATIKATTTNFLKPLVILVLLGLISLAARAQDVTFSVNMEHAFLESGDKVVVRGSVPGLGNWEEQGQLRLKKDRKSSVYTGKVKLKAQAEAPILYKFVILRSGGAEQWEQRGNRIVDPASEQTLWFDDRSAPGIQQTVVQVTFRLDLGEHSMNGFPAEGVAVLGAHAPLSFELETGRTELTETSEGLWETTVAFPYGTPHDVPFKFAWLHDGEWMWEWRAGHTNHVFMIDDSQGEQLIQLRYDPEQPGVVPVAGSSGQVDDYEAVLQALGDRAPQSRYGYEKAMRQLTGGDREGAKATYAAYKAGHPGKEAIDDFQYQMTYEIQKAEGIEAAQAYIDARLAEETDSERTSYFGYLKGELLMNAGRGSEARRHFKKVLNEGGWELASDYARKGIVHSYLTEPDSVQQGIRLLEQQLASAPAKDARTLTRQLARAYRQAGMEAEQDTLLARLATQGKPVQQAKGKVALAERYLDQGRYSEALGLLDMAGFSANIPKGLRVTITRAQLRAYHELEMYNELATLYKDYRQHWPEDPYRKRLAKLNAQALEQLGPGWDTALETATPDSTGNR